MSSVEQPGTTPDPKRWLALFVIIIAQLMIVLDASIVNIALPSAQEDLGISDADRQWVVTAYTLTFGGFLLLGGRIADYMGRKRTFIVGLLGFAAASALGGIASTAGLLYAARGLQGTFAALMAPAALSLISVTFTETTERAKAFGAYGAVSGGGAAIGLILGGSLTEYASWRWCLGVNVPIALATAAAAVLYVKESKAHGNTKYDIPGAILVTLGLVSLVYGFTEAAKLKFPDTRSTEVLGWTDSSTLTFLGVGVVLLIAFVLWELRTSTPLLPMKVALDRNRGGSYLVFLFIGAGLFAMFLFLTFYFQITLGYSPIKGGFAFLPFSIGIIGTAGVVANLLPKIGPKPIMVAGLISAVIGMLMLTQIDLDTNYWTYVLPSLLFMSIGMACVFIPASSTALIGVGEHDAGVASALLNTSQQVGGSLGVALLNTLYAGAVTGFLADNLAPNADPAKVTGDALIHGYHVAFFWGSMMLVVALVFAVGFINAKKDDIPNESGVPAPA
ncbi:EmrB/QacA subfamily drug resistance transporter [Aeromicrobium panaciterrae]|uniref:EmrB/QacA subfamily drug resistance transporter n=1 Tax=Aeromicrobium panaciterrae TaxID=363861 RepID=A0ABU1UP42_9ACTN|nr:MFS transporter [Aeromicrobium panaciterrae]MDR7086954.1 EmrB/QacA subfamily drug resistance transporter [Aeromicrobium panaciterrae]